MNKSQSRDRYSTSLSERLYSSDSTSVCNITTEPRSFQPTMDFHVSGGRRQPRSSCRQTAAPAMGPFNSGSGFASRPP